MKLRGSMVSDCFMAQFFFWNFHSLLPVALPVPAWNVADVAPGMAAAEIGGWGKRSTGRGISAETFNMIQRFL